MNTPSPAVVLMVDDQVLVAEAVRRALAGIGDIAFHHCADGREAVAAARRVRPTVILQDLVMPGVDGLDLLPLYRADPEIGDVPVLVLSTTEEAKTKARAFELGANDYLVKLPDRAELLARLRFHSQSYLDRRRRDEADRALRASLQLREDFAHMVIHDLGTPLATILMDADELISSAAASPAEAALLRIRNNALRLREMAHDMLLLAKMEEGKLRIDAQPHDPLETIQAAVQNLGRHLQRRDLAVRQTQEGPPRTVPYDANLILRVLDNILSNAIKFSPPSGVIAIRTRFLEATGTGPGVRIEIENQGPAIPDEMRERIFEKFEIGQTRSGVPQIGLGLAFCRRAIEAHGGRIEAAADCATGALFRFEF